VSVARALTHVRVRALVRGGYAGGFGWFLGGLEIVKPPGVSARNASCMIRLGWFGWFRTRSLYTYA
jgi:hypothetical protein